MAPPRAAPRFGRGLIGAVWIALLFIAAFFASFYHPEAPLSATVIATAVKFVYHPVEQEPTGGAEKPLLAGASLNELAVRSFDTLTVPTAILSVRDAPDQPWKVLPRSGPIVIGSSGSSAQAIFPGVTVERWRFTGNPTVSLEFPGGQPVLRVLVEGEDIELFFDAGESIDFECQLCRIDGLDEARMREVRLSEMNHVPVKASSGRTLILNATPGPKGFGEQRFRISSPWLCGGKGRESESTVMGGSVKFENTGVQHQLTGQGSANRPDSVVRLMPVSTFTVTALRAGDLKGRSALEVQLDGRASRAEKSAACDAAGAPFQPSLLDVANSNWLIKGAFLALGAFIAWATLSDKLQGYWTRMRSNEAGK